MDRSKLRKGQRVRLLFAFRDAVEGRIDDLTAHGIFLAIGPGVSFVVNWNDIVSVKVLSRLTKNRKES